ncbi:MAG: transketolase family protein [Firmicutes bacterium]|nr:transketolase family protein [Bacillota bacterium]
MADIRETFVKTLIQATEHNPEIVVVVNDSISSSRLKEFQQLYPTRVFNVGIAEQNLVGFSAGLAASGLKPWACSATSFLSYRATEQIRNDVIYSGHNVKLVGNTSGVDYGPLGVTHHSLADVSLFRSFPGFYLIIPADHQETEQAVHALLAMEEPAYLRLYRGDMPYSLNMPGEFQPGKIRLVRDGEDCALFATGRMVQRALEAADILSKSNLSVSVVNVNTLTPLDVSGIIEVAEKVSCLVTVEEHAIQGALGGAICETVAQFHPKPVLRLGFPNAFSVSGQPEAVREHYGLTAKSIARSVQSFVQEWAN